MHRKGRSQVIRAIEALAVTHLADTIPYLCQIPTLFPDYGRLTSSSRL